MSNPEWSQVKKWAEKKIALMRAQNDNDLDETETAKLRGRIQFAKEVIALGNAPEQKVEITDNSYT